jgi:hypothetical protein
MAERGDDCRDLVPESRSNFREGRCTSLIFGGVMQQRCNGLIFIAAMFDDNRCNRHQMRDVRYLCPFPSLSAMKPMCKVKCIVKAFRQHSRFSSYAGPYGSAVNQ